MNEFENKLVNNRRRYHACLPKRDLIEQNLPMHASRKSKISFRLSQNAYPIPKASTLICCKKEMKQVAFGIYFDTLLYFLSFYNKSSFHVSFAFDLCIVAIIVKDLAN